MCVLTDYMARYGLDGGIARWVEDRAACHRAAKELDGGIDRWVDAGAAQAQAQAEANAKAERDREKVRRHAFAYGMGADKMREQAASYNWTEYSVQWGKGPGITTTINAEPGTYEWKD